jgi:hypothetical protein
MLFFSNIPTWLLLQNPTHKFHYYFVHVNTLITFSQSLKTQKHFTPLVV